MNERQFNALYLCCVAVLLMALFPPFETATMHLRYGFLLSPPDMSRGINVGYLLAQLTITVAVTGLAVLHARPRVPGGSPSPT